MTTSGEPATPSGSYRLKRTAQVIIVTSVMFSFISYWRTAAVVLCDLGSTAYYIGGIVEQAIGAAAPWFILAVMIFDYLLTGPISGVSAGHYLMGLLLDSARIIGAHLGENWAIDESVRVTV